MDLLAHLRQHPGLKVASGALRLPATDVNEAPFQGQILKVARDYGWLAYHTHDSRRSAPGFPDLTLAKPGHPLILAELKRQGNKLSHDQEVWLGVLARTTGVAAYAWWPQDFEAIATLLTAKGGQ